jgi:predicted permease
MRWMLGLLADEETGTGLLSDLEEEFEDLVITKGVRGARRWYRGQALRSGLPLLRWRFLRRDAAWRRGLRILLWSGLVRDARYAVRSFLGAKGFSVVVVLTFGLGIGANTAVFSLVHSVILDPIPVPGGDRLVTLWRQEQTEGMRPLVPPAPEMVRAWQEEQGIFEEMGAYSEEEFHLLVGVTPVSVRGARVSPEILTIIAAAPTVGRLFSPDDARPDGPRVALLTEGLWRRNFGSDPGAVGRSVVLDGESHLVVGVLSAFGRQILEAGFFGDQRKELLVPLAGDGMGAWPAGANVVARLEPGLSAEMAQERLDVIQDRVVPLIAGHSEWFPFVSTPQQALGLSFRRGLWVMMGGVGIVLLILCANTATLLLVRMMGRAREFQVRLALGAGRLRLAGQLVMESLIQGGIGILLAIFLAGWLVDGAKWVARDAVPEVRAARVDPEALAVAVVLGLATIVLFSLIPALHLPRIRPAGALGRDARRERRSRVGWTAHRSLVVGQVALALLLVVAAGLLSNSLVRLLSVDPGFEVDGLAAVSLDLPQGRYDDPDSRLALFDEVVGRLEGRTGVEAVGWARFVPPRVAGALGSIRIDGQTPLIDESPEPQAGNWVSPEYFGAIGAPFLEGRPFTGAEVSDREQVVILNQSASRRYWPNGGAVGSRIQLVSDYGPSPWLTVVGIVPDIKAWWLGDAQDRVQVYLPASDVPPQSGAFLIRAGGNLGTALSMVQEEIQGLDPTLPVGETFWVGDALRQSVARQRFQALLLTSFGTLGVLLAVLGVYGVLSLSVVRRSREIGVRLALGATGGEITRSVVLQGLRAITLGSTIGLALSLLSAPLLVDLLWGVDPKDLPTLAAGVGGVLLAGLAATFLSARKATGVDPVEVLRRE